MDTKAKLEGALKEAMRNNDDVSRRTIRMALASIKLAEVEKGGTLDETALMSLLQKETKTRREAIADAEKANRPDLIAASSSEIEVLRKFMPEPLSQEDLRDMAQAAIEEVGASSPSDMGRVIKLLMPRVQGRAPGDQVSQVVRQLLQK